VSASGSKTGFSDSLDRAKYLLAVFRKKLLRYLAEIFREVYTMPNLEVITFCGKRCCHLANTKKNIVMLRFHAPQLVPPDTAEARISYGNSVCLSVCPSVTTRYGFKARWDRDSGSSPYDSLEYLVRPPGTVVPGGLMFYCWCLFYLFIYLFVSGTLRRYISELPRPIAVKLSDMIGSVWT